MVAIEDDLSMQLAVLQVVICRSSSADLSYVGTNVEDVLHRLPSRRHISLSPASCNHDATAKVSAR